MLMDFLPFLLLPSFFLFLFLFICYKYSFIRSLFPGRLSFNQPLFSKVLLSSIFWFLEITTCYIFYSALPGISGRSQLSVKCAGNMFKSFLNSFHFTVPCQMQLTEAVHILFFHFYNQRQYVH